MTTTPIADGASPSNGRRLPLRALAALSFLTIFGLVLLAACGGGNEESTTTPAGTRAPTATQAPTETQSAEATESPAAEATQTATEAPQASGGEIDPCSLLTKAEVEAAIGTSVTEPEPEETANLVACNYNDPSTPIFHLVSVTVLIGANADEASDLYELAKDNAAEAQTVGGLGDDAFWDSVFNGLEVLKGKYDFRIDVSPDDGDELAIAKDLAAKALDRLP
jgi:hypothetical protein